MSVYPELQCCMLVVVVVVVVVVVDCAINANARQCSPNTDQDQHQIAGKMREEAMVGNVTKIY